METLLLLLLKLVLVEVVGLPLALSTLACPLELWPSELLTAGLVGGGCHRCEHPPRCLRRNVGELATGRTGTWYAGVERLPSHHCCGGYRPRPQFDVVDAVLSYPPCRCCDWCDWCCCG